MRKIFHKKFGYTKLCYIFVVIKRYVERDDHFFTEENTVRTFIYLFGIIDVNALQNRTLFN